MKLIRLFRKSDKRRECVEMIKQMAAVMSFPAEEQKLLRDDLDLSIATDEQVDTIHKGLVELQKKFNDKYREDLFTSIKGIQN